ncbi:MAG: 30S ribosomal protein S21 [Patescibacteria group bacterium]
MVEVKRKQGESFESMLRRFGRRVQRSGKLLQAKKIRFHAQPKSKFEMRASALHRKKVQVLREHLYRIGKLSDEDLVGGRRRQGRRS